MSAKQRKKANAANSNSDNTPSHSATKAEPLSPHSLTELDASTADSTALTTAITGAATSSASAAAAAASRPPTVSSFISKLYAIVSNPSTQHIICWADHGQSFLVKDEYAFSLHIMRHHFRHSNFSSFVRQLNFYGFHKRSTPSAITQVRQTHSRHTHSHTHIHMLQVELHSR